MFSGLHLSSTKRQHLFMLGVTWVNHEVNSPQISQSLNMIYHSPCTTNWYKGKHFITFQCYTLDDCMIVEYNILTVTLMGGGMAEWLGHWTWIQRSLVQGFLSDYLDLFDSSPEDVYSQLVSLPPAGVLKHFCSIYRVTFSHLQCPQLALQC